MSEQIKATRIKKETARLNKIYKALPAEQKKLAAGLIERASYLRVALEDLEKDLDLNGFVEFFTQSEKLEPYERERPSARLYANYIAKYTSIHRQLAALLDNQGAAGIVGSDDFDKF